MLKPSSNGMVSDLAGSEMALLRHYMHCLGKIKPQSQQLAQQLAQSLAASYPWVPNLSQIVALAAAGAQTMNKYRP